MFFVFVFVGFFMCVFLLTSVTPSNLKIGLEVLTASASKK